MKELKFTYTNWKGITSERTIDEYSINIYYGEVIWHKGEQWLMKAYDIDKQDWRTFAIEDIDLLNRIEILEYCILDVPKKIDNETDEEFFNKVGISSPQEIYNNIKKEKD